MTVVSGRSTEQGGAGSLCVRQEQDLYFSLWHRSSACATAVSPPWSRRGTVVFRAKLQWLQAAVDACVKRELAGLEGAGTDLCQTW